MTKESERNHLVHQLLVFGERASEGGEIGDTEDVMDAAESYAAACVAEALQPAQAELKAAKPELERLRPAKTGRMPEEGDELLLLRLSNGEWDEGLVVCSRVDLFGARHKSSGFRESPHLFSMKGEGITWRWPEGTV